MNKGQAKKIRKTWIDWEQLKNMTPEMAYILGLLWADGYVILRKEMSSGTVSLSNIEEDGVYFSAIFKKVGCWTEKLYKIKDRKPQINFRCYELKFVNFLIEMDYKAKSNVSADKIISYIPKSIRSFWFLGLVDGDGCFYINPNNKNFKLTITSTYEQDWAFIEKLAKELNITYRIKRTISKNGKYSKFEITSRDGIIKFGNYLYGSEIGLPRKRDKFLKIKEQIEGAREKALEDKGIYYHKTKNIFEIYETKPKQKYIGVAKTIEAARELRKQKLGF